MHKRSWLAAVALCLTLALPAGADVKAKIGDWPAWRGADRTNLSQETGLLKEWPKDGPKLLWTIDGLGDGWSTPSIVGGRIYLMGTVAQDEPAATPVANDGDKAKEGDKGKDAGDKKKKDKAGGKRNVDEVVIALEVDGGKKVWSTPVGKDAGGYPGPRSTPTVDGDWLYVVSSDGKLACLNAKTGDLRWTRDFKADFGGKAGGWAYTESPLIDGDVVVATPGGDKAFMVALKKDTGEVVWKADHEGLPPAKKGNYTTAAYSSVIVADVQGERQYIQFVSGGVVGVSAKDGKLRWHYDHPANGTANISTPIFHDNCVFAASGYGTGGGMAKISRDGDKFEATEAYFVPELQNHHGGILLVGDHVYGTGGNSLLCIDFKTGKIDWQNRSVGKGSLVYADGNLIVRSEGGDIGLVEANPEAYHEKGRFKQPQHSGHEAWPHPVVAGGKLYIRDWDKLLCYDVKGN